VNAFYHSVQNLLSSNFLSKNLTTTIQKKLILPVVSYGYETCSPTVRDEHKYRVSENRVLRILAPKREEVAGGWSRLHNKEPHNMNASMNI
jgi:hypothetical protein